MGPCLSFQEDQNTERLRLELNRAAPLRDTGGRDVDPDVIELIRKGLVGHHKTIIKRSDCRQHEKSSPMLDSLASFRELDKLSS